MRGYHNNNSTASAATNAHDKYRLQQQEQSEQKHGLNNGTNMSKTKQESKTASTTTTSRHTATTTAQTALPTSSASSSAVASSSASSAALPTSSLASASSSTPRVRIWLELGGPDGSGAVEVGQATTLTVRAIVPGNMGVRVVDCAALDGLGESTQQLLDERGCPIDEQVSAVKQKN